MKLLLRSIVLLLLTLSVLLGSVGVALSKQLCQMAEKEVKALAGKTDECCEKKTSKQQDDNCCIAEVSYKKLEPVSSIKTFSLEIPIFFAEPLTPFPAQQFLNVTQLKRLLPYTDTSPRLYGRNLLLQIQILNI